LVFYHAKITLRPERAKEQPKIAWEADLSREAVIDKIGVPFAKQVQFFCGGTVINPARVEEIRFGRTEQPASEVVSMIKARRRANQVLGWTDDWEVLNQADDVTREILEAAPLTVIPTAMVGTGSTHRREKSKKVFIVHGHDLTAVEQTELLLHRIGLEPVVLKDAPSGGRTVIEKFEAHSDAGAAIVLLTPDDVGGKDASHLAPRARQNVIWEWGYLVSRLGRANVICIYKGGVEIPSDLHGIVTIHVSNDVKEQSEEIKRELKAAGYRIT
jgi:predicted nucleotide-binding protein